MFKLIKIATPILINQLQLSPSFAVGDPSFSGGFRGNAGDAAASTLGHATEL
jgi:hypothetical protein